MKPRMPQKQKRRPRASDTSALEANSPWKYKALPLPSWSKWEILVIMGTMISLFYMWLYSQSFHFHVAHVYACFGYSSAQLIVGQRYLKGAGVVKDEEMAMHWFRDVEILLNVAARQGVQEAQELLENVIWTRSKLSPTKKMRVF